MCFSHGSHGDGAMYPRLVLELLVCTGMYLISTRLYRFVSAARADTSRYTLVFGSPLGLP
jgi:hypothetical protein